MRIVATYFDGFTERLLRWRLTINDQKAYLEADWFQNATPLCAKFRVDQHRLASEVSKLAPLKESYAASWTDLEDRRIKATNGDSGVAISRHVYGASVLAGERSEVRSFMAVWGQLESLVTPHLPAAIRGQ
jgi:hypothetical protein